MPSNLGPCGRVLRLFIAVFFFFAAWGLYEQSAAQIIAGLISLYALGEAVIGYCPLYKVFGCATVKDRLSAQAVMLIVLAGIQITIAYEWGAAAFEKWSNPEFIESMPSVLGYFSSANPYEWFTGFLTDYATPNAELFGHLVRVGQTLVAAGLVLGAALFVYSKKIQMKRVAVIFSLTSLLAGMAMNAAFYFAAGWTGPGTHGINVVMFWTQAMLVYFWTTRIHTHR